MYMVKNNQYTQISSLNMTSVICSADSLRVVIISDTHGLEKQLTTLPAGDVLIHAGDFTRVGSKTEIIKFKKWMAEQSHTDKIFIAGNHELSLDTELFLRCGFSRMSAETSKTSLSPKDYSELCRTIVSSTGSTYLEDSTHMIVDNNGREISIYGSPYQPEFCDGAFNLASRELLRQEWSKIPSNVDIVLTHSPPYGILDELENFCGEDNHAGCKELLTAMKQRVKPRLHVFGHLHFGYGTHFEGETLFVNGSTCTNKYEPSNPPIVVDLPFDKSLPARLVFQ